MPALAKKLYVFCSNFIALNLNFFSIVFSMMADSKTNCNG